MSQVFTSPIGVVPLRISNAAGAPPPTIGDPGAVSWWITTPLRLSAACSTTAAARVTGEVAPARGMETSSAGTPLRGQAIKFCTGRSLHSKGRGAQARKLNEIQWGQYVKLCAPDLQVSRPPGC